MGAIGNDDWYTLLVSVRGTQIRCSLDGNTRFTEKRLDHPQGAVGLHVNGSRFAFRNIKVTAPDGKVLLAGLPDLSPPTPLPPVAGVAVVRGADGARVKTAKYEALLGSDGCLYSLTTGGVEFLRPGEPLLNGKSVARGAYFYCEKPPYRGVVAMQKIEQTAGNVFKAGGDKFSVTYEFAPDAVRLKATNATDEKVPFFFVLDSASVANLVNDGGDQLSVPVVGQPGSKWETTTWAAGRSALKIVRTDPGDVKLWGPFGKAKSQVWEGDVGSYQTAEIRLEPIEIKDQTATTSDAAPPPEDDPIRDKLDKAKAVFDAAVEKYQQKVHDGLDKVEESATKAGNKDLVAQVQAEREAFDGSGDLPKSLPSAAEFKQDEDASRSILDSAYATAIKAYTNGKMETKADAVKEERKEFQEGHPTDAFRVGSVWKGKAVQIWVGHPDTSVTDCSLSVFERDDKSFKARVEERGNTLEVQGSIVRGAIRWLAKDVKVIKGGPEHDTEGKLKGNLVELQSGWLGGYRGKPNATVLTVQLRLQKK